jgi:hypothetical protein
MNDLPFKDDEPAGIVRDVLGGHFVSIFVLCDWLSERLDQPVRRWQYVGLRRAIGRLHTRFSALSLRRIRSQSFADEVAIHWNVFRDDVRSLFLQDLHDDQELINQFKTVMAHVPTVSGENGN